MKKIVSFALSCILLFTCSCSNKSDTEKQSQTDYTTLNSSWECDYLKISINSEWEISDSISTSSTSATWSWDDGTKMHTIFFTLGHSNVYKKLTQSESIETWENSRKMIIEDDFFEDDLKDDLKARSIKDSFVKNGQAYLIVESSQHGMQYIEFYADSLHGSFEYSPEIEDTMLDMIDSIVFY